jgi:hypothetical protein
MPYFVPTIHNTLNLLAVDSMSLAVAYFSRSQEG